MGEGEQGTPSFLTTGFPWSHPCHLGKCICMYVCICLGICMCTHMHICVYVCMYICLYVGVHLCAHMSYMYIIYAYVYIHVYVCMCTCMCTCAYACLCVYMCMFCFRETCQVQSVCLQGHRSHFIACQNLTVAALSNTRSKPAGIRGPVDLCPPVSSLLCSGDFWY